MRMLPTRSPTPRSRWRVGRKEASSRWLRRQDKDPYVAAARRAGFASRAAYKLLEINKKAGLLKNASAIVDLGAAPGSWSAVAKKVGGGRVVAVDIKPFPPPDGVLFLRGDITDPTIRQKIAAALGGKADLVLCDAAPDFSGNRITDRVRAEELALAASKLASSLLAEGGSFLLKVFGNAPEGLNRLIGDSFTAKRHFKPASSRRESAENYLLAIGFRTAKLEWP